MTAADTSAVVAAFASWHESHEAARRALDEVTGHLRGHANLPAEHARVFPLRPAAGVHAFRLRASGRRRLHRARSR